MKLVIGKEYVVTHPRKGKFKVRIEEEFDEFFNAKITGGMSAAILDINIGYVGDRVSLRKSFCTFEEVK